MSDQFDTFPEPGSGTDNDLRIAHWLTSTTPASVPSGIELQVLQKVRRRRLADRAVIAGIAAALLTGIGIGWHTQPPHRPQAAPNSSLAAKQRSAGDDAGLGVNEADLAPMAASAPVASFALVGRNQLALLESLKSLVEE